MEIKKKNIHMCRQKAKGNLQITLEDDFNVPDTKPDIEHVITSDGSIEILENNLLNGKCMIKGVLSFGMIYISSDVTEKIHNIQGKIEFDEMINLDNLQEGDQINICHRMEDLNISLINSRKISVRSLLYLECTANELYDHEIAVDFENTEDVACCYKNMKITEMAVSKKDIFRIKENFHLSTGKPNINEIIYYDLGIQGIEMRIQDEQISLRGELLLFVIYRGTEERERLSFFEAEQPFHTTMECNGCMEDMILQVDWGDLSKELQVKTDEDGEERTLEAELSWEMGIKVYKQEDITYLADAYSLIHDLQLETQMKSYRNLVKKTGIQKRITTQIPVDSEKHRILQICHNRGQIQMEEQEWREDGIYIEGSVETSVLYIGENDHSPMGELKISVPFSYSIEEKENSPNKEFLLTTQLIHMTTMLLGKDSLEVKIDLGIDLFVFENQEYSVIENATQKEISVGMIEELPSIVGYQVQKNEELWDIAKQFHTTMEDIEKLNQIEKGKIRKGDKILLLKKVSLN